MKLDNQFNEIRKLIIAAKQKAYRAVNKDLITLYWEVGEYVSKKVNNLEWGNSVVKNLSEYIQHKEPDIKGFSSQNIWRMKQFYETYHNNKKLSPLVREISWSNNLLILSKTNTNTEKEFYLRLSTAEKLKKKELERQLDSNLFERFVDSGKKLSPKLREIHPQSDDIFRDSYLLDFLNLPKPYNENDLRKRILRKRILKHLKSFILEFGKDFIFIGDEYRVQVGNNDFFIDLLFYHRELQCLVAIELKTTAFKPEHLGKMEFYLEALDRDVKKEHEKPSVGIILCKYGDTKVVEYALSRSLSPALVAKYQTELIETKILENKLDEFYQLNENNK